MHRLTRLFQQLQTDKDFFLRGDTGADFEQRICRALDKHGFNRITPDDLEAEERRILKKGALEKHRETVLRSPSMSLHGHYIRQICGSQDYPDFLIFDGGCAFGVEVKFSTGCAKKPVWNSGLPRPNGIYIFGSRRLKDCTFFRGADVVSPEHGKQLHEFFEKLRQDQERFNKELRDQPYGFQVYVRKAFDQSRASNDKAQIGFFDNPQREALEKSVIDFINKPPDQFKPGYYRSLRG